MVEPATLLSSITTKLKAITGLVSLLGASQSNIVSYLDYWPGATNVLQAIDQLTPPKLLVIYDGTTRAQSGRRELWQHNFRAVVRSQFESSSVGGYGAVFAAMMNGKPTGSNVILPFTEIHSSCQPFGAAESRRQQILVDPASMTVLEYFEITFSLTEKGA